MMTVYGALVAKCFRDDMANDLKSFRITSGMDIWIADDKDCWVRGVVAKSEGSSLTVRNIQNKAEKVIIAGPNIEREVLPSVLPQNTNISDIIKTEYLHEASLLETLRIRHSNATSASSSGITCEEIYTYAGPVLLSCNPYKRLDIYGPDVMRRYSSALEQFTLEHHHVGTLHVNPDDQASRLPPHVFCIAQDAYANAILHHQSSAIVITGESGAGKTEAMKLMLRYLTVVAPNVDGSRTGAGAIEQRLLDSSPITEAFGNAKTVRNDNSSRFGKFMELVLDAKGCISGGNLRNYMLEKSRISAISAEERSYHIFYMLCEGSTAEERDFLSIPHPEASGQPAAMAFNLLKHGKLQVPDKDDLKDMEELRQAVATCGFGTVIWRQMLCVVAAVLHLSNLTFTEGPNDTSVMEEEVGSIVARLLSVDCETLKYSLTHKVITPQGVQQAGGRRRSVTVKNLNAQQAAVAAASLAQALYSAMFNFIIHQINSAVIPPSGSSVSIGLLDIFGFEIFAVNKFEQLCINYTNEKLQNLFNHHMFELELAEYAQEEVDIAQISFQDNNRTVALFEMKKVGIFDILDDEMVVPKATDLTYLDRLTREMMGKHEAFDRGKSMHDGFIVKHYAHNVKYTIDGFIQKNSDLLTEDITSCLSSSSSSFVVDLLSFGDEKGDGVGERSSVKLEGLDVGVAKAKRKTVGSSFKQQLVSLCERVGSMTTFYVRTFKTNTNKSSGEFDRSLMLLQLKCSGVMEVMKIRIAGFPTRIKFAEFVRRFWPLHPAARSMPEAQGCVALLQASKLPAETFTIGKSKVFLKDRPFSQLSIMVKEVLEAQARELQRLIHRLISQMRLSAAVRKTLSQRAYRQLISQMRLAAAARRALSRRAVIRIHQALHVVAAVAKRLKCRLRWVAKISFDGEVSAKNAAERAARKLEREAAHQARVIAREDRETKERLRQERLRSMRVGSEPIEKAAAELNVQCPLEVDVVSERQYEGMLHKYRAKKLFKTWQPRVCTIEGLALVYKGKADGKVRGVVSLKDCVVRPAAVELGEGAFVIKSGTPFPTEIKDKKNRSFLQGRDYIFKPDPKDANPQGVRDEWFKQIIHAQIASIGTLWMPLQQFNKLNSDASSHLQQLAAADSQEKAREESEDAPAEAAAAAEADAQNFWPDEKLVAKTTSAHVHRLSRVGAQAAAEAAAALGQLQLAGPSSTAAPPSARRDSAESGGSGGSQHEDSNDDAPPPVPSSDEDFS